MPLLGSKLAWRFGAQLESRVLVGAAFALTVVGVAVDATGV